MYMHGCDLFFFEAGPLSGEVSIIVELVIEVLHDEVL